MWHCVYLSRRSLPVADSEGPTSAAKFPENSNSAHGSLFFWAKLTRFPSFFLLLFPYTLHTPPLFICEQIQHGRPSRRTLSTSTSQLSWSWKVNFWEPWWKKVSPVFAWTGKTLIEFALCMVVTLKQVSWLVRHHWTTWPKIRWMSLLTKQTLAPFWTCELGKNAEWGAWACGLTCLVCSIEGIPGSPISLHYPTAVIKVSKSSMVLYRLIQALFSDQGLTDTWRKDNGAQTKVLCQLCWQQLPS